MYLHETFLSSHLQRALLFLHVVLVLTSTLNFYKKNVVEEILVETVDEIVQEILLVPEDCARFLNVTPLR